MSVAPTRIASSSPELRSEPLAAAQRALDLVSNAFRAERRETPRHSRERTRMSVATDADREFLTLGVHCTRRQPRTRVRATENRVLWCGHIYFKG